MKMSYRRAVCAGFIAIAFLTGCEGRPTLFPNSDPALQKTSTQFSADAARRFPYPGDSNSAGLARGRAEIDVMQCQLQILNYGEEDWRDIDVWVNQSYVCHLPRIAKSKEKVETISFAMLYNSNGDFFSTQGGRNPINRVEIYRDGKLFQIPLTLAD